MAYRSEKVAEQFLKAFNLDIFSKGKVLTIEKTAPEKAYIILKGDVLCYKKLFRLPGSNNEAKD